MTKEFIPYDCALALKELGFNEECCTVYNGTNILVRLTGKNVGWCFIDEVELIKHNSSVGSLGVSALLYQQAFRWFREKCNLSHEIQHTHKGFYPLIYEDNIIKPKWVGEVLLYEEAELECIKQLIKIVKEKK